MWKHLFQEHILLRGLDYFISDLVGNVYVEDNLVEATVFGTEEYKVEIMTDQEDIIDLNCTCPYADGSRNCKHMAAVLFYLDDQENVLEAQNTEKSIVELVETADVSIIKSFLIDVLKHDEKLINRFKNKLQCDILPTDMMRYKNQVNNIFSRYIDHHDFVDYNNAFGFIRELQEILYDDIRAMLDNNQLKEAFELTNYIFVNVANQDMDDSAGGTNEIASTCLEIWNEISNKSDIDLKKEMFKWFMDHLNGSIIDYMEDYIEKALFDNFKEEAFMESKSAFLDDKISEYKKEKDPWVSKFRLRPLVLRRLELFEEMRVNQNIIEAYCVENLDIHEVREYYIKICIQKKNYDLAIKLLKEGKDKEKDWPGIVMHYSLKLKNLYKKIGKYKLYEEELWALVLNYNVGDEELFKELKSIYSDNEWMKKREIVFDELANFSGIDKLYELEGLYDRLIELILNSRGLYMVMKHESTLKDIYPKELLEKYENVINDMATNTSSRKHYRDLVSILRRMAQYPMGEEKVSEIVNDWKLRYRNRPAMMDELSKL